MATWYTPNYGNAWANDVGGGTPVMAANLKNYEDTLLAISSGIGLPAKKYLTGTGTETTAFQNWVNAAQTFGMPMLGDDTLTITINNVIDMRGNQLRYIGNGMRIVQSDNTKGIVKLGGYNQVVTGMYLSYNTQAPAANTGAIGIECYAMFQGYYGDLHVDAAQRSMAIGQSDWDGTGQNTVFSCIFEGFFALGWSQRCLDMITYPSGGASSTGNVFSNFYMHNNPSGVNTTAGEPLAFVDWDESHFEQINLEWCNLNGNDVWFMQRCRNFAMTSVHFEGLTITGNRGIFRPYENSIITARAVTWTNSPLQTGATVSIVRPSEPTTAPMYFSIDGLRIRQMTGTPTALCIFDLASDGNSVLSRYEVRNFSTVDAQTVGELVLGDSKYSPCVQRINDSLFGALAGDTSRRYRAQSTMPRDSVQTNAAGTLTNGQVRMSFFTAEETRTYSQVRSYSGTVAGVGATLIRFGLYSLASGGTATLVARTASQTGAFAATNTAYTYAMNTTGGYPASYTVVAGQRYALAQIVVGSSTAPTVPGQALPTVGIFAADPPVNGSIASQTDLPTTTTFGSGAGQTDTSSVRGYMELVP